MENHLYFIVFKANEFSFQMKLEASDIAQAYERAVNLIRALSENKIKSIGHIEKYPYRFCVETDAKIVIFKKWEEINLDINIFVPDFKSAIETTEKLLKPLIDVNCKPVFVQTIFKDDSFLHAEELTNEDRS